MRDLYAHLRHCAVIVARVCAHEPVGRQENVPENLTAAIGSASSRNGETLVMLPDRLRRTSRSAQRGKRRFGSLQFFGHDQRVPGLKAVRRFVVGMFDAT